MWRIFLPLVMSLAGCVPAPLGTYYKPIYPDSSASYAGNYCGGNAGAPATLSFFVADGVSVRVSAQRYGEGAKQDLPLAIAIEIPQHAEVQFSSDEFRISQRQEDPGLSMSAQWFISASAKVPSTEWVDMEKIAPTKMSDAVSSFAASTGVNFSWENFVPSEIAMRIPAILVSDKSVRLIPHLDLVAKAKKRLESFPGQYKSGGSLIYPTEKAAQDIQERYSQCREQTPTHWCEQILLSDTGEYKIDQAGFSYSGRWYVYDVDEKSPFRGEVVLKYKQPVNWKFASNELRVNDTESGGQRSYQFDSIKIHFSYQVPFQTQVRGVGEGGASMSLSASLGTDEAPAYYVKLPPVRINGKEYVIKPIKLERRSLDFGLLPFNC